MFRVGGGSEGERADVEIPQKHCAKKRLFMLWALTYIDPKAKQQKGERRGQKTFSLFGLYVTKNAAVTQCQLRPLHP